MELDEADIKPLYISEQCACGGELELHTIPQLPNPPKYKCGSCGVVCLDVLSSTVADHKPILKGYPCQRGKRCLYLTDTGIGKKICGYGAGCVYERGE